MSKRLITRREFVKQSALLAGISTLNFPADFSKQESEVKRRPSSAEQELSKMPNIIIFCPDEMVAYKTGTFGHPLVKTPNMDRLANMGVAFENHFTCHGKCVPSRVSLMTGAYPHAEGFRSNQNLMPSNRPNLASTLKQVGYETALAGKNHCFAQEELDAFLSERLVPNWKNYPAPEVENKAGLPPESFYRGLEKGQSRDAAFTDVGIEFIKRKRERPFFLWLNNNFPHPPYRVREPFFSMYDREDIDLPPKVDYRDKPEAMRRLYDAYQLDRLSDDDWRELIAVYYGMISHADYEFGRVLDALEETRQLDNTIVIFWSDHGDFAGEFQLVEKWDTCMQDCLTNTPLIMSGPGIPKGKRIAGFAQTVDVTATIYDLLGIEPHWGIQGLSLRDLMLGKTEEMRDAVFSEGGQELASLLKYDRRQVNRKPNYVGKQTVMANEPRTNIRARMVRTRTHKLIYRLWSVNELYDLESDPHELHNFYNVPKYKEIQNELIERLLRWEIETETFIPPIAGLRA
ncbi:MAG: sulfatase-like hydrolase/transferase [bacterium]